MQARPPQPPPKSNLVWKLIGAFFCLMMVFRITQLAPMAVIAVAILSFGALAAIGAGLWIPTAPPFMLSMAEWARRWPSATAILGPTFPVGAIMGATIPKPVHDAPASEPSRPAEASPPPASPPATNTDSKTPAIALPPYEISEVTDLAPKDGHAVFPCAIVCWALQNSMSHS